MTSSLAYPATRSCQRPASFPAVSASFSLGSASRSFDRIVDSFLVESQLGAPSLPQRASSLPSTGTRLPSSPPQPLTPLPVKLPAVHAYTHRVQSLLCWPLRRPTRVSMTTVGGGTDTTSALNSSVMSSWQRSDPSAPVPRCPCARAIATRAPARANTLQYAAPTVVVAPFRAEC